MCRTDVTGASVAAKDFPSRANPNNFERVPQLGRHKPPRSLPSTEGVSITSEAERHIHLEPMYASD
ncbi:MAG: hypothetical protein DI605_20360 [Sphingomonas sp.]|nr:MAG: hypothetical protein DI605_20360 [Sphingomonas sp.]